MKCEDVQIKLSPYQDGELKLEEQEGIRTHLQSCQVCRGEYAQLQSAWEALGKLPEIRPSPLFYERLVKRMNATPKGRFLSGCQWGFQLFSPSAIQYGLLIAGILVGSFLGNFLVGSDLFPFRMDQGAHPQQVVEIYALRAFDPVPPGTLGEQYLRMANYGEEARR